MGRVVKVVISDRTGYHREIVGYDDNPGALSRPSFLALRKPSSGLRIAFDVRKGMTPVSDTATIRIWNLSPENRSAISQFTAFKRYVGQRADDPVRHIEIEAGYQQGTGKIFSGEVRSVLSRKEGPDWVTEIEALAVFELVALTSSQGSISGPVTYHGIVERLLKDAKIKDYTISPEATAELQRNYRADYAYHDSPLQELRRVLSSIGLTYTIDLGVLKIMPFAYPANGSVVVVNESTGLIGVPRPTEHGASFRSLLDPKIVPGQLLVVSSATLAISQGAAPLRPTRYTAVGVTCIGDTHGGDWYSDVEGWFYPPLVSTGLVTRG